MIIVNRLRLHYSYDEITCLISAHWIWEISLTGIGLLAVVGKLENFRFFKFWDFSSPD